MKEIYDLIVHAVVSNAQCLEHVRRIADSIARGEVNGSRSAATAVFGSNMQPLSQEQRGFFHKLAGSRPVPTPDAFLEPLVSTRAALCARGAAIDTLPTLPPQLLTILVPLFVACRSETADGNALLEDCTSAFEGLSPDAQKRVVLASMSAMHDGRTPTATVALLNAFTPLASRCPELGGGSGKSAMTLLSESNQSFTAFLLRGVAPEVTDSHGVTDVAAVAAFASEGAGADGDDDVHMSAVDALLVFGDRIRLLATVFRSNGSDRKLSLRDIAALQHAAGDDDRATFLEFVAAAVGWASGGVLWTAVGGIGATPDWASKPFAGIREEDLNGVYEAVISHIRPQDMSCAEFYCYAVLMLQINVQQSWVSVPNRLAVAVEVPLLAHFDVARSVAVHCREANTAKAAGCFVTALLQAAQVGSVGDFVSQWACEVLEGLARRDPAAVSAEDIASGLRLLTLLDPLVGAWTKVPRLRPHSLNLGAQLLTVTLKFALSAPKAGGATADDAVDATGTAEVEDSTDVTSDPLSFLSNERFTRVVIRAVEFQAARGVHVDPTTVQLQWPGMGGKFFRPAFLASDRAILYDHAQIEVRGNVSGAALPRIADAGFSDRTGLPTVAMADNPRFMAILLELVGCPIAQLREPAASLILKLPTRCVYGAARLYYRVSFVILLPQSACSW